MIRRRRTKKLLRCLTRRMDFLASLMVRQPDRQDRGVMRKEVAALKAAIPVLEAAREERSSAGLACGDIGILRKRQEYLESLIQKNPGQDLEWERGEVEALRWGIPILAKHEADEAAHHEALRNGIEEDETVRG